MHGQQCNTCGAFDDSSTRSVAKCSHCPTLVCDHCKSRHEPYCERNQKILKAGGGATIANVPQAPHRHGHEIPEDVRTPGPERVISKPAVAPEELRSDIMYHAAKSIEANHDLLQMLADDVPVVPAALDADAELAAMRDLLNGK